MHHIPQRLHSLDNLRAAMMWLGIVLHVAVNHFQGPFPLPWRDPQTTPFANLIFGFIHAFRMPAFFIVAGFFVAMLVAQRGWLGMLKHRLMRLGLPFVVFWPVLYLFTGLLIMRYMTLMADAGTGMMPAMEAPDRPTLNTFHLWFIYYLLWFCLAAAACAYVGRFLPTALGTAAANAGKRVISARWGIPLLTLPLVLLGSYYPSGVVETRGSFIPQPAEFFHYGLYFAAGWLLYRNRDALLDGYARNCWRYAAAGMALFIVSLYFFEQLRLYPEQARSARLAIGIVYNATGWLWSFAAIGLFLRYLPRQNRLLAYMSDSAYWTYLVHMLCTIGFGILLYRVQLGALSKMAINIAATTAVCLASYHVLVRYTYLGTLLNGRRHEYKGFFTWARIGIAVALVFAGWIGVTQIKFAQDEAPLRAGPPARISVPADIAEFLGEVGKAYGAPDSKEVGRYLASDFLHQGMDKTAFLDHLQKHQRYLGKLDITPIASDAQEEELRVTAYAVSPQGALTPSLQLLPLHAGATIVKENGKWKLRGNQQRREIGLYKEQSTILADFEPADLETYKRLVPTGFSMPATPYVRVSVTYWRDMEPPQTPYRLSQLSILVNKNGADIWHLLAMPETDWLAVEAGKTIGFPKFVADIDISKSFGNAWQVDLRQQGKPLAEIHFDPVLTTKATRNTMPSNPDEWVIFGKDGLPLKSVMTELMPPLQQKAGYGWMTVNPQAAPWKDLLVPGSRAPAVAADLRGPRKLHVYALNDAEVPADIREVFGRVAEAWTRQDMNAVLENYHPAFMVTNQRTLAFMRRTFELTRRYEWKVKDIRVEGDLAWIKGEVQTDIGVFPASSRLIREKGRWLFYGDGGSVKDRELPQAVSPAQQAGAGEFEAEARKAAQETIAAKDDLQFDRDPKDLWAFSVLGNAVFKPAGSGRFPALVLLHDCSGRLGPGMRQWIDAALKNGHVAMAVDSMRGHPTNCTVPLKVPMARRVKDAYDSLEHLRKLPFVDPERIAVAGFSQGGVVALLLASKEFATMFAAPHRFAAVSAVYPMCYFSARYGKYDIDFLRQDSDIPLQVLMGGEDIYTPAYDCMPGLQKLQESGAPVEWHTFPQAGHGWDILEANGKRTISFRGDVVPFIYDRRAAAESRMALFEFLKRRMDKEK